MNEETTYHLIKTIATTPITNQRDLAEKLGISLGKLNYCLKALLNKGLVKAENFRQANNKRRYIYQLTPAGLKEKAAVTIRFLKQKQNEYEKIKLAINQLQKEVKKEAVKI
jgi:EPS-associated MarR family transcriptional regulator